MRRLTAILLSAFLLLAVSEAQDPRTFFGFVTDSVSGERLIGATIIVPGTTIGTVTTAAGFFSVVPGARAESLSVRYVGYRPAFIALTGISGDERLDVRLAPQPVSESEVVVEGMRAPQKLRESGTSVSAFRMSEMTSLPSVGGEVDILKGVQTLAGVSAGSEYSNEFYVRGGNADQNLIRLDGVTLYNTNHFFGYFGIFNGDAIQLVELLKSGIPAEYSGRLSSVLNVTLKNGSREAIGVSGGISLVAARATVEGPIGPDKQGSFMISGRRTFVDPVFWIINGASQFGDETTLYFYDLTAKVNYDLSSDDRLHASGYFGRDAIINEGSFSRSGIIWGNAAYTLSHDRIWSPRLFTKTTFIYSDYQSDLFRSGYTDWEKKPSVRDLTARVSADAHLNPSQHLKAGLEWTDHAFAAYSGIQDIGNSTETKLSASEASAYLSHDWTITQELSLSTGLVGSWFSSGRYSALDPRIGLHVQLSPADAIRASYTRIHQYVHLLSSASLSGFADVYYPSTSFLPPQSSEQWALGWDRAVEETFLLDGHQEWTVELYYKRMHGLPIFSSAFTSAAPEDLEQDLQFGEGESYGLELEYGVSTPTFDLRGSYTLSRSTRMYAQRNGGRSFPAPFDRTHQIYLTGTYRISDSWTMGAQWILTSGRPIALPHQTYTLLGLGNDFTYSSGLDYGEYYDARRSMYNRLDLSASYTFAGWGGEWEWFLNLYNVYFYPNPIFIDYYRYSDRIQKITLGFIPSVGINFKF